MDKVELLEDHADLAADAAYLLRRGFCDILAIPEDLAIGLVRSGD